MNDATETLVIINSVAFTIFLIAGIICLAFLMRLLLRIRRLLKKAENVTETLEHVSSTVSSAAENMQVTRLLMKFANRFAATNEAKRSKKNG